MNEIRRRVLKVGLTYAVLGGLWIFLSDLGVSALLKSEAQVTFWQTVKGWFYVVGTALILSFWFARHLSRQTQLSKDLTESRTESQEQSVKLREASQFLDVLLEQAPVMVSLMDEESRILWVNRNWELKFGWGKNELDGVEAHQELYPEPAYRRMVEQFIRKSEGQWREFRPRSRNGERLAIELLSVQLADGSRLAIGRDITEQRKIADFRDRLFQYSADLMSVTGFDDSLLELNPAWERVLGWKRDELIEKRWLGLLHPEDLARTLEDRAALRRGLPVLQSES